YWHTEVEMLIDSCFSELVLLIGAVAKTDNKVLCKELAISRELDMFADDIE
ncbi:2025_t:CDS:2, partial [Dentiscutata heterogama]